MPLVYTLTRDIQSSILQIGRSLIVKPKQQNYEKDSHYGGCASLCRDSFRCRADDKHHSHQFHVWRTIGTRVQQQGDPQHQRWLPPLKHHRLFLTKKFSPLSERVWQKTIIFAIAKASAIQSRSRHNDDERQTLGNLILKIWTIFKYTQKASDDAHAPRIYLSFRRLPYIPKAWAFSCYSYTGSPEPSVWWQSIELALIWFIIVIISTDNLNLKLNGKSSNWS